MINIISNELIDSVFGGAGYCTCYGYAKNSRDHLVKISIDAASALTNTQYMNLKTWCYNSVHYQQPPLKSWKLKCFFDDYSSQGTDLNHFEDYEKRYSQYLFEQYTVITPGRTGIV